MIELPFNLLMDFRQRIPPEWRGEINQYGNITEIVFGNNTRIAPESGLASQTVLSPNAVIAELDYELLFPIGFNPIGGGKVLGLASFNSGNSGCIDASAMQGMSARFMFSPTNGLSLSDYTYKYNKTSPCGETVAREVIQHGVWNKANIRIVRNTFTAGVANADGSIIHTVNGVVINEYLNLIVEPDETKFINIFMYAVFFGGGDDTYRTKQKESIFIKNCKYLYQE